VNDSSQLNRYRRIAKQLDELIAKTDDAVAHRATAAALLHHKIPGVSWTGFYLLKHGELVVDAYQGPIACLVLEKHVGVCWAAIDQDTTQIVDDVHVFPGHIPCDDRSRSEVVVPIHDVQGRPVGVLDIDSHRDGHFDEVDGEGCRLIVDILQKGWNTTASGT